MAKDPEHFAHQQWLGFVQPVGLVVSIPALLQAQAHVNRNIAPQQRRFLDTLPHDVKDQVIPQIENFPAFACQVLGWEPGDLVGAPGNEPVPTTLEVALPEYHERLRPTYAVREVEPQDPARPWMMLIEVLPTGTPLDSLYEAAEGYWYATPQHRFERLLRETQVPAGLLVNGTELRLVYAPRGETSGYATFRVKDMTEVAGRPIFAALHMLLCAERLFSLPAKQRLPAILADSRKYQNVVSTELADQVLEALYELVRGFQAADEQTGRQLLAGVLATNPDQVYAGLLTVLMRLVFVLYAEDRDMLSTDPVYTNFYSVTGLFDRLRTDEGRYHDTMDQRYGAWAQLLTLFRFIHAGGSHGALRIPARSGYLFDPDRYKFLEGRTLPPLSSRGKGAGGEGAVAGTVSPAEPGHLPLVADGVIFRVLSKLLILDGERLNYRTLDVEQIGSVYEATMGFTLSVAEGSSIAIKPLKRQGAPATINLEALLAVKPADRAKWLKEQTNQKLTGQAVEALKSAGIVDDLLAALEKKIARTVTPNPVPKGAMVLQPSDARRTSGSNYTPRSLTEPIVRTTLRPILEQLVSAHLPPGEGQGEGLPSSSIAAEEPALALRAMTPTPDQILSLKICDPAMGSGAFHVEACRQLGDELVKAWHVHDCVPKLPPDEDEVLHARRLVAQRCLYGVDKNPMAVDLAKLSLWLATLAKDHPFTFLDHCFRCGDSLVGLTREQIAGFHWAPNAQQHLLQQELSAQIERATEARRKILAAPESTPYADQQLALAVAEEALDRVRRLGDLVIAAFFSSDKDKEREAQLGDYLSLVTRARGQEGKPADIADWLRIVSELRQGPHPIEPFHWEIEFPEVFSPSSLAPGNRQQTTSPGFDAIVGNPPFAGKNTLINGNRAGYVDWLKAIHEESHGNADLVAHFFRRAFNLLRDSGTFGLIATNTIGQGDTRSSGLRWICTHDGTIYQARKRLQWPGEAAVVVSVVHVVRGPTESSRLLDGRKVPLITAYLFHAGGHDDPHKLTANDGNSFQGSIVLGMGFTFDDTAKDGAANPLSLMEELIRKNPKNAERIFPYIGGEEINENPTHAHHRYVINFGDIPLQRENLSSSWARGDAHQRSLWLRAGIVPTDFPDLVAADWPDLLSIVESKVKGTRASHSTAHWWHFERPRIDLYLRVRSITRALCTAQTGNSQAFAFIPAGTVWSHTTIVFPTESMCNFAVLQSRLHQNWARNFGATMKDDLRYLPSDCFETFPFPPSVLERSDKAAMADDGPILAALEAAGQEYYEFRAGLLVTNNEGLTKTYNRFHDPDERSPNILKLREFHAAMDRTVLEAYGWHDLAEQATCEFLLDYEDDEEDAEEPSAHPAPKARGRKKPWRYRWPDPFRDEVLARLLALNADRAEQERLAGGGHAHVQTKKTRSPRTSKVKLASSGDSHTQQSLPQMD